jgi:glycolate oxidase FAD binding subunit
MTAESLSQLLAQCSREGRAVAVHGAKTLSGMGLPPQGCAISVSTLELNAVVEDAPTDMTIAVQSGITLRTIAHTLAQHHTFIPFDAPHAAAATVGGTLAAGWLGPRRHLYGRPRDLVIGTTIVLADGTIARAGGMVVKNVAGYDMSRLYVGSFGTLGVLVRANFKTLAAPPQTRAFHLRLPEATRARAMAVLAGLTVSPAAALWIDGFKGTIDGEGGTDGRLFVLLEGSAAVLERGTRDLRSALGRAGVPETVVVDAGARESFERVVDAYVANLGERSITYRLSAHVDDAASRADAMRALAQRFELRCDTLIDVMNGDVIVRVSDLDAHALGAKIEMFDDALHDDEPHAIVIAGAHPHRASLRVWGDEPDGIDQMRALKARFDPQRILNPGCFVGGI